MDLNEQLSKIKRGSVEIISEEELAALDTAIDVDVSKVEVTTEKKDEAAAPEAEAKE